MGDFELRSDRLVLRTWREADRDPFAQMNADPVVMEFFPKVLDREMSDALVDAALREFEQVGFCPWVVEDAKSSIFMGFVGLRSVPPTVPFAPAVEVGWRLARPFWGNGYATEAGARALRFGFEELGFEEIVSFTSVVNVRSRRVMERLEMMRDPLDDFEHPAVPVGNRLRPHVLYRAHIRA